MKKLDLVFYTEAGKTASIVIDNPKENLTDEEIRIAMDQFIQTGAFLTKSGRLISKKEARVFEQNVVSYNYTM